MAQVQITTIRVLTSTKGRLDEVGKKGESYDDIINKVLNQAGGPKK